jgi:hypothetical protein
MVNNSGPTPSRRLLPVLNKNPVARSRELCTILLEASQNGKITLSITLRQ